METIVSVVGIVTIGSVVGSICTITNTFYLIMNNIQNRQHDDILDIIQKSDITETIKTLKILMSETKEKNHSIDHVLMSIETAIKKIEYEFTILNHRIRYNKRLYVPIKWRCYDLTENIKRIEKLIHIINARKNNLCEILKISDKLTNDEMLIIQDYDVLDKFDFDILTMKKYTK